MIAKSQSREVEVDGANRLRIRFDYDPKLVGLVRTLPGRRWWPAEKLWTCINTPQAVADLRAWGFCFSQPTVLLPPQQNQPTDFPPGALNGFGRSLHPFQQEGVRFLLGRKGRAILADEMGLGKTVEVLAWLHVSKALPALVVCPASAKLNWQREAEIGMPGIRVRVLEGRAPHQVPPGDIYVINYDLVSYWAAQIETWGLATVVLDEAHYIKNRAAKRTKAIRAITKTIAHVIAVSGTPITNRPIEFYEAIRLVAPNLLPNFWEYAKRYCAAQYNGFGWDFTGSSNEQELHQLLAGSIMIRRKKADVLTQLPPKVRSVIPLPLSDKDRASYRLAEDDFIMWCRQTGQQTPKSVEGLALVEKLKQLVRDLKLASCIEWIEDHLQENGKLVVFATHIKTLDQLQQHFGAQSVRLDGSTPPTERQEVVDRFQNEPGVRLFLGNLKAAGTAITLTAASATCFLELGWSPGDHDQAEDRIHRIGQEADSVLAYYLVVRDTIEESILKLLDKKRKILDQVLDGGATEQDRPLLMDLVAEYKENARL